MDANWVSAIATFVASCVSLYIASKRLKPEVYIGCSFISWNKDHPFGQDMSEIRITAYNRSRIPLYVSSVYFSFPFFRVSERFRFYRIKKAEISSFALIELGDKENVFKINSNNIAEVFLKRLSPIDKYTILFMRAYVTTTSGEIYSKPIDLDVWRYICSHIEK